MKTVTVWHFAGDALRDGSPLPKAGDVLPAIKNPQLCSRGWHGSERLIDALTYAPGANLARRVLSGDIQRGDDKYCASECTMATGYVDARPLLIEFARYAALRALREYAPAALERAGLKECAAELRNLPDDCNLRDAVDAAYAACAADAADAAARAAYAVDAAYAADAADAAARAARAEFNSWLEARALAILGV